MNHAVDPITKQTKEQVCYVRFQKKNDALHVHRLLENMIQLHKIPKPTIT